MKRSQTFKRKKVKQLGDITESYNSLKKKRSCQCLFTTPPTLKNKKTNLKFTSYSKMNLKVLGVAKISLGNRNSKKCRVELAVINEDYTPLLVSSAAQQMVPITV